MGIRESSFGYWSSTRGFLWVASGVAIGVGNIARLPYLAGEYGGIIFLVAYFIALAVVAWPLLVAEWMIGRWSREDLPEGLLRVAATAHVSRAWALIGVLSLLAAVLILSYYSVIAGWSMAYAVRAAGGALQQLDSESVQKVFYTLAQDPERSLAWHTIFMVIVCIVVGSGVRDGIEKLATYLVPTAILLMSGLFIYAYSAGGGEAAMRHMLTPDWTRFGWRGALEALHQAFFTMALGLGAMYTYASYVRADVPLGRLATGVIVIDTLFSLVAGGALYSLVFAAGLDPAPGLTLLFQVFPLTLSQGVASNSIALLVYLVLFMTTLAAAVALMEPAVRTLVERYRITRVAAGMACGILIWFIGLGTLLSFNVASGIEFLGRNFFDWIQWITGRLLLPLIGLLLCIFISRILPTELMAEMWGEESPRARVVWQWMMRYPVRLALIVLLVYCIGLLDFMVQLWS